MGLVEENEVRGNEFVEMFTLVSIETSEWRPSNRITKWIDLVNYRFELSILQIHTRAYSSFCSLGPFLSQVNS